MPSRRLAHPRVLQGHPGPGRASAVVRPVSQQAQDLGRPQAAVPAHGQKRAEAQLRRSAEGGGPPSTAADWPRPTARGRRSAFLSTHSNPPVIPTEACSAKRLGFPGGASGKESVCQCRRQVRKIPWRRAQQPTPLSLSEKSHGQRTLEGFSP